MFSRRSNLAVREDEAGKRSHASASSENNKEAIQGTATDGGHESLFFFFFFSLALTYQCVHYFVFRLH